MDQQQTPPDQRIADLIFAAYEVYHQRFAAITGRARDRFVNRDWSGMQADAGERLGLYSHVIADTITNLQRLLSTKVYDRSIWTNARADFGETIAERVDRGFAKTFFNSVTRKIFDTVGVNHSIEFVEYDAMPDDEERPGTGDLDFPFQDSLKDTLQQLMKYYWGDATYPDLADDAERAAERIQRIRRRDGKGNTIERIELVDAIFFRGKGAFLVGQICGSDWTMPLVLAFRHPDSGIQLDAVLATEDDVSILFSFTRSYFHVIVNHPAELVRFLKKIMPAKRTAELYIALGFNKHGKTELYRDLVRHLAQSTDQFAVAPGDPGMVMIVFALPSYDMVFKIIRDVFLPPKSSSRQEVMERYDLVFRHDRAGRLIDAQEFEHLAIARERFSKELLDELINGASHSVTLDNELVVIKHCYVERRITPLNLYLKKAPIEQATAAGHDYGQCIKELAAANIFPGDLLPKNFGVTRHGRIVFYDYDELRLLEMCNFRQLPTARDDFEETSAEPWFYVGPDDIFPEEFRQFLGLPETARCAFLADHDDLLTPGFWWKMQKRHEIGDLVEILPYASASRIKRRLK